MLLLFGLPFLNADSLRLDTTADSGHADKWRDRKRSVAHQQMERVSCFTALGVFRLQSSDFMLCVSLFPR